MNNKPFYFLIFLFAFTINSFALNLDISIYTGLKILSFSIKINSGKYSIIDKSNNKKIVHLAKNDSVNFTIIDNKIKVHFNQNSLGKYDSLELKSSGIDPDFNLYIINHIKDVRTYEDNLKLSIRQGNFLIINNIELEKYIAAVVESEGGLMSVDNEFYKVQAIICRSYAVKSMKKHIKEGFNLCDNVHCQVYKGKCKDKYNNIKMATFKTAGDVIVDENKEIISATYHSNSGGQTMNSEDVWNKPLPYLRSVKDTFSLYKTHTNWEKQISTQAWLNYLSKTYQYPVTDNIMRDSALTFTQNTRKAYFPNKISLCQIRTDFNLNSTFFSIINKGDSLVFKGKGYGHGVGLSQEGAMQMAKQKYNYVDIIKFYYKNIEIVNFEELKKLKNNNNHF